MSIEQMSKHIGINVRNTKLNIKKLKDLGFIERIGPAKGGYWKIIEQNND